MPRCCGSAGTCACKIEAGRNITVTGTGSTQDPTIIAADVALGIEDNKTFDITMTGTGRLTSPWILSVNYAPTASVDDLPDVDTTGVVNGQVLSFNTATQKWQPAPPTTAAAGGITTDASLDGDGSVGDPLLVRPNAARYLMVDPAGVGLTDEALNRMLRFFPDAPTRATATPAPIPGTLSMLATAPGVLDYYDGTVWAPLHNGIRLDVQPGEMLALSGNYAGGPVVQYVSQLEVLTAIDGTFEVIPALDLALYAGVLSVCVSPVGSVPWCVMLTTDTDRIIGLARRVDDGSVFGAVVINACVTALLY